MTDHENKLNLPWSYREYKGFRSGDIVNCKGVIIAHNVWEPSARWIVASANACSRMRIERLEKVGSGLCIGEVESVIKDELRMNRLTTENAKLREALDVLCGECNCICNYSGTCGYCLGLAALAEKGGE